jgi:DNA-binding transcriptional LysR family regulator
MDIDGLTDFVTLAACKSFSKAAALRNITQPAFSRRIQALEASVDTALVDRRSKDFRLTAAGERFLVYARSIIDLSTRAIDDAKSTLTRLHEPVYIAAPAYVSKTFFPRWYKAMQKSIPGLAMRISQQRGSDAIEGLHKGTADFALVLLSKKVKPCYNLDDLVHCSIGTDKMIAVRSRQSKDDKLLMYEQGSYMNSCAEFILGETAKHDVVFETSSTGLMKEMALAGFGTAVLPQSVIEDDLDDEYLVPIKGKSALVCDVLLVRNKQPLHKKAEKLWAENTTIAKT